MKVVFVSNYFNHHQKPFCEEMYRRLGGDFAFISTSVMSEERKELGYSSDDQPEYVHLAYEGEQQKRNAAALINTADVVIAGSAPNDMFYERIRTGKLLLRYAERPFKRKASLFRRAYHFIRHHQMDLWKKNIYMLCAGGYVAKDYASIGMYQGRTYKWGYFPVVKKYDMDELFLRKRRNVLMWCGRFIDWKHPDDAILLAKRLKEQGYDFHLNIVGTGDMEEKLHKLVRQFDLTGQVQFLGSMAPDRVRTHMEEAGIYLLTSDRQEGWGAVLNEAMSSGCAVVASDSAGAVPYLICDGENGAVYPSGNQGVMFEKVKYLLDHPEDQKSMGQEAYQTMEETWNANTAAERVLRLAEKLLAGEKKPGLFEEGPCSMAPTRVKKWSLQFGSGKINVE